jgi:beta-glucosidase
MPGQSYGGAIADVLYGKINPSGKLPVTFPNKDNETAFTPEQWPGVPLTDLPPGPFPPTKMTKANYTERMLVGYRYYDAMKIAFTR